MIDTKKAKSRILSLAFRGELVDYPAKIKKNTVLDTVHGKLKNYVPVSEMEYLTDAPAYWNWSRLGYVTSNHGQTIPEDDFCYIDVGTLDNVHQRLAATENHVKAKDAPSRARKVVHFGDVLYSTVRPYLHNICIVNKEFSRTPIASTAFCVMHANEEVLLNKYLFYWLLTAEFDKYSNGDPAKGTLYPAIGEKDLLSGGIPLPSLEEQSMIADKIETAFNALDAIDELQKQYADNLTVLKSKLIDAAIQGKLTEQLPEDGTAEELYQQIQEEKQALIKAGKIKKEKPLPEIGENEIPFEIPENWKWCRVINISYLNSGNQYVEMEKGVPYIKVADMNMRENMREITTSSRFVSSDNPGMIPVSSIIFPKRGGAILTNKKRVVVSKPIYIDSNTMAMTVIIPEILPYIRSWFESVNLGDLYTGTSIPQINNKDIYPMLVPLPPLAEQKRIVARLDQALAMIEV